MGHLVLLPEEYDFQVVCRERICLIHELHAEQQVAGKHWCHFLVVMFNDLFRRLPSEVLIKILSYLDASALFTISHVNKLFYQFASDK